MNNELSHLKKVASAVSVYFLGSVISGATGFLLLPVLTRYLLPEDYGLIATYSVISEILVVFIGINAFGLIVRKFYEKDADIKSLISSNLLMGVLLCIFLGMVAFVLKDQLAKVLEFPAEWIIFIFLLSFLMFFQKTLLSVLQAQQKARSYISVQLFFSFASILLSIFLIVYLGMDWKGRLFAAMISLSFVLIYGTFYLRTNSLFGLSLNKDCLYEIKSFGLPLIPHFIGGWVMTSIDRLYLNNMVGVGATGLYSVAFTLAGVIFLLVDAVNKAILPVMFEKLNNISEVSKERLVIYTYVYDIMLILMAVVIGYISKYFLGIYVGAEYQASNEYVFWLALAAAFTGSYRMRSVYVLYTKKTYLMAWTTDFLGSVVNLILCPILILLNGPIGAAQSTAIAYMFSLVGCWKVSQMAYPMPWFKVIKKYLFREGSNSG